MNEAIESNVHQPGSAEGLLFTGDVIRELSVEQLVAIGDFANRMFGLEMQVLDSSGTRALSPSSLEKEPKPIPVTRLDFVDFAVEHGIDRRRAASAWRAVHDTHSWQKTEHRRGVALPKLRFLDTEHDAGNIVDLRSLRERLVASRFTTSSIAFHNNNKLKVEFLRAFVEDRIGFEDD